MKAILISATGLLLSFALMVGGIYGCSEHETSRWGQPQDAITHMYAGASYLGLIGIALTATCLMLAVLSLINRRRD